MPKYKVILNPISGRGMGRKSIERIKELLSRYNLDFDLVLSDYAGHAIELARQAVRDGYNVVVAAGGDGTANEVVNGLMQAKKAGLGEATFAMLGVGRGNDFAFGAGIPMTLEGACQVLTDGQHKRIDLGWFTGGFYPQGRYFINGIGIGFDAIVNREASKLKNVSGMLSYLMAALKTIFLYFHAPKVRIELDDKVFEQPALIISAMNGRRLGGVFMIAPNAVPVDGLFDTAIAGQVSRLRIFTLLMHAIRGTHITQPDFKCGRVKKLSVTVLDGGVLPAQADGEMYSLDGKQLTIEVVPQAIEIVCR